MRRVSFALAVTIGIIGTFGGNGSATRAADTTSATAQADPRIRVVFFPITGAPDPAIRDGGQAALKKLIDQQLNANNPLYFACLQSTSPGDASCDPSRASIIVSTTIRTGDNGNLKLVVSSVDFAGHRTLGSIQKDIATKNGDDTATIASLAAALTLGDADVKLLIGTPVVRNGVLSTLAGYQPFIQLIPDVSTNEPTYLGVLQNLLAKRGIASVPSSVNAGTVTSGSVGADTLCGLGQRYFVYSIAKRTEDRILSLNTRIETRATGHLYDCPSRSDLAFGDTARTFATNTKQSLGPFLALLGSLFISKTTSWQNATATGVLVTNVVDVPAANIQEHTAEITLQKLVDNFCDRLPALLATPPPPAVIQQTIPSAAPTAAPSNKPLRPQTPGSPAPAATKTTDAASKGSTTPTGTTGDTTVPLDIGNFLADASPALTCGPARYRDLPDVPAYRPIFDRRP